MTVWTRQFERILAREMLKHMIGRGRLPNASELTGKIKRALGNENRAIFKFVSQPSRSLFQHKVYNDSLWDIKFDVETLHQELLSLYENSLKRFNYADLFHKVHTHELNVLQSKLDMLLFTVENADFYFLGAFDNFTDVSKMDQEESTRGVIDLAENALALPSGGRGNSRINAAHLYSASAWPVTIITPDPSLIVKEGLGSSSAFGNMFSDLINTWVHEVITSQPGPVELMLRFPLAGAAAEEAEVFINRLELVNHSADKQKVTVKVSTDDINYLAIKGYEDGLVLEDSRRVYAMDFETNLVQYIELRFRKEQHDAEIGTEPSQPKNYQYLFGLKSFGAYTNGRLAVARYQSKPFVFSENPEQISKISIQTDHEIPDKTSISYAVALANDSKVLSSFVPIKPVDKTGEVGAAEIVNFGTTTNHSLPMAVIGTAQAYGAPFKGKQMYRIGSSITPTPIFGTAVLFRGFKVWFRDSSRTFQVISENDQFVDFATTDLESFYTVTSETVNQFTQVQTVGDDVQVTVNRPIYYDSSRGHALKPDPSRQQLGTNVEPNFAVYQVIQIQPPGIKNDTFLRGTGLTIRLPSANFVLRSSDPQELPVIRNLSTGGIYVEGTDFNYISVQVSGLPKPTGYINIVSGSALDNLASTTNLQLQWVPDPDVTHKVTNINGSLVVLGDAISTGYDSGFTVTYRFVPKPPSEIIKASIRVKNQPSTGTGIVFYTEGTDYVVDARAGAIQRIPTGNIPAGGSVYTDFQFRDAKAGIETFQTWVHVPATGGTQVKFDVDTVTKKNKLVVDTQVGEAFFLNSPEGLVDLTNAVNTPIIPEGWSQFIVRSKNPTTNISYQTNLIDQVIQLRDSNGKRVFRDRGTYFDQIIAFRQPLVQRTLNHLKVNTLVTDHTVFAIDEGTNPGDLAVVVAFEPNQATDLYLYVPDVDTAPDGPPTSYHEDFRLDWSSKAALGAVGDRVVVRVDLRRDVTGVDGGISPKVFEYRLRASF